MTIRQRCLLFLFAVALASWIILLGWLDMSAKAGEGDTDQRWVYRTIRQQYRSCDPWTGHCYTAWRYVRVRHRNHAYYLPEDPRTRVHAYERRYEDRDDHPGRQCLGATLDVLSTEHQTEDNAREAARKLMMAKIQWTAGGQYMDLSFAADLRWRCSASNAHDTASGRLAEAAGQLTGRGGQNVRCALWVRPCKAPREKDQSRRDR